MPTALPRQHGFRPARRASRSPAPVLALALALALASPAGHAQPRAAPAPPSPSASASPSAPPASSPQSHGYADHRGGWQGPVNFQAIAANGFEVEWQARSPLALTIAADGAVSGQAAAARCAVTGVAQPYRNIAHATLELRFSGCADPRLNGPYTGRLLTSLALEHASLRLHSGGAFEGARIEASAILRR